MKINRQLLQICLLCGVMLQAAISDAQPITKIATGYGHSLFLKSDGSLWAMGWNQWGQLGDGTYSGPAYYGTNRPEQIVTAGITMIVGGDSHTLFLKSDGSLWAMGLNTDGELGDGTLADADYFETNRPELIVASNVTAISAGLYHSLFLKDDGSLWAMGFNQYGQLGDGNWGNMISPEQIMVSNVTAIAAGGFHSLLLKSDGSLWATGKNDSGQLGDGTYSTDDPYGTNRPEQIIASNVTAIAAGGGHSLFLKSDGSLWAMGDNSAGQLGDGTYNNTNRPEQIVASNVTAIAAGYSHSLFLKNDGSLWAMGWQKFGQLGDGVYSIAGPHFGTNQPQLIVTNNVVAIAAGGEHSLFLKSDGSLWAMGHNDHGQLGDGTTNNVNRPEQILAAYNQITGHLLGGGKMQLSFVGIATNKYALDRSLTLSPPTWIPQVTNPANSFGALTFTNTPNAATNNFWRIRSVP